MPALENPTTIIATLGPATEDDDVLRGIIQAGADLVRLNFSHGDRQSHQEAYRRVRRCEQETGRFIGVIADLQGPKIRTGRLVGGGPVHLHAGGILTITTQDIIGTAERVSTTYAGLPDDLNPGDRFLMDDGLLELRVTAVSPPEVRCEVLTGGPLGERKGINLPGIKISSPTLTAKDRADLEFAVKLGVDYVALSFVRSAGDLELIREAIAALGSDVPVIAKLEKPEAIAELEQIIAVADAVMVARGDLGVEMPPESVPMLQKRIIRECARRRVPVITATQMLDSMREHPRPTRAEASDVANAILDGTDAVMLSGETAIGRYPVQSVAMMRRIAQSAEEDLLSGPLLRTASEAGRRLGFSDALGRAAVQAAEDVATVAIVAFTQSGFTARLASKCRPRVPILAATPLLETARRCTLYWAVKPVLIEHFEDTDAMFEGIEQRVREMGVAKPGDVIVVTAGSPIGERGTTNMMKLQVIR